MTYPLQAKIPTRELPFLGLHAKGFTFDSLKWEILPNWGGLLVEVKNATCLKSPSTNCQWFGWLVCRATSRLTSPKLGLTPKPCRVELHQSVYGSVAMTRFALIGHSY